MGKMPVTATRAWWVIFSLIVAGGAFALGGVGPAVFAFALAGICVVMAVRYERRQRVSVRERLASRASEEQVERFRRLWLVSLVLVLVGVVIAFVSGGTWAGTVALACAVAVGVGGAVALVIMRNRDERS
jgi:FtsH-binding integral membrane protein